MKIYKSEHVFDHPWETVVQAAQQKYPNPLNPSVLGVDVLDREVGRDGVLRSHRLMSTEWGMPSWLTNFVGLNQTCYVSEHSEVNPGRRTMNLRSRNLTFSHYLTINEQLTYVPHPEDSNRTLLTQEAVITVKGLPLTDYLEGMVTGTCSSKALVGRQGMEWVISKIKEETSDIRQAAEKEMSQLASSIHSSAHNSL